MMECKKLGTQMVCSMATFIACASVAARRNSRSWSGGLQKPIASSRSCSWKGGLPTAIAIPIRRLAANPSFLQRRLHCSQSLVISSAPDLQRPAPTRIASPPAPVELPPHPALRRLQSTRKIRGVLMGTAWGPGAAEALKSLNVEFDAPLVAQVLWSDLSPKTALCFFNWLKDHKRFTHSIATYSRMISTLKAAGLTEEIPALIEEFLHYNPDKTARNLLTLICWYGKVQDLEGALCIWRQMQEVHVKPAASDYAVMIDLFAGKKRFHEAATLYLEMVQDGRIPGSQTYKALINHLVEDGNLDAAYTLFEKLGQVQVQPTMVTYCILMAAYAKAGNEAMVKQLGKEMRGIDNRTSRAQLALLRRLRTAGKIKEAHLVATEVWPEVSVEERSAKLLELGTIYGICEGSDGDEELPEDEDRKGAGFREAGYDPCINPKSLADLFEDCTPDTLSVLENVEVQWTSQLAFEILRRCKKSETVLKVFFWLQRQPGFKHDRFTFSKGLDMLADDGQIEALQSLLDQALQNGSKISANTFGGVVRAFGFAGKSSEALNVFRKMDKFGVEPSANLYGDLIHALVQEKRCMEAKEILDEMQRAGFQPTVHTFALLIECFGLAGGVEMAEIMFKQISKIGLELKTEAYKALAEVYFLAGKPDMALKVFEDSQTAGVKPCVAFIVAMIRGLKASRHKELHNFRAKFGQKNCTRKRNWHLIDNLMMIHDLLMRNLVEKHNAHHVDSW